MSLTTMSERDLSDQVIHLARLTGWKVHHCRASRRKDGSWATAISGYPGFPDLILIRPPRLVVAELKSARGRLSTEQDEWLDDFKTLDIDRVEVYVWRPDDFDEIQQVLAR